MTEPIAPIEQSTRRHSQSAHHQNTNLPRVTIKYCTQYKWMLRAAYFAQELLSTFGTTLGEVALVPATGGVFTVTILHYLPSTALSAMDDVVDSDATAGAAAAGGVDLVETLLWDRKTQGGFPEVKQLKALVRNIADPTRSLGHVDRALDKAKADANNSNNNDNTHGTTEPSKTRSEENTGQKEGRQGASQSQEACEDCQ